jgi:hypothetical protein
MKLMLLCLVAGVVYLIATVILSIVLIYPQRFSAFDLSPSEIDYWLFITSIGTLVSFASAMYLFSRNENEGN